MADEETLASLQQQVQQMQQQLQAQQKVIQNQEQWLQEQQQRNENEALSSDDHAPPHLGHAPQNFAPVVPASQVPDVWFAQVEAQFSTARITQDWTRYDYVVTHLDSRYVAEVCDILANPPADDRYLHLKKELDPCLTASWPFKITRCLPQQKTSAVSWDPLRDALAGQRGNHPVTWTPALTQAFKDCKTALCNTTLLSYPKPEAPLGFFTDASSTAVGAPLMQRVGNNWSPLALFSKKFSSPKPPPPSGSISDAASPPAETTWPVYYRELLAIYEAVQHFRHIFEEQHCTIYTDHKPITYAFSQRRKKLPPVQQNQLSFIAQCTTDIHHISGKKNVVADALSRVSAVELPTVTTDALAEAQKTDTEVHQLLGKGSSLQLQKVTIPGSTHALYCDISTGRVRPYVPSWHRQSLFNQLHNLSHSSIRASTRLVTDRYAWPSMQQDCRTWARTCIQCHRAEITRHVTSPLGEFPLPTERFQHVHIDIIGPLPPAGPYRYCLIAMDRNTRSPEVWPLERITAEDVASAFFSSWVSHFGTPRRVPTDQGRQFESQLFRLFGLSTGFERSRTTSYHPCANGMIEQFHRQFKAAIMCHPHSTWLEALPAVALGLRATFKPDIQVMLTEFIYGEPLRLPGELLSAPTSDVTSSDPADFVARLRRTMTALRPSPAARHIKPTPFVFEDLATCSHAFLRDDTVRAPFQQPYSRPCKVICRDDKTFTLQISEKDVRVSIDHLKSSYILFQEPTNLRTPPVFRRQNPATPRLAPHATRLERHVRVLKPFQP
nr:uncharacterized protein LOC119162285 [Rhipicephalus microplus]